MLPGRSLPGPVFLRCCDERRKTGGSAREGNAFRDLGHNNADAEQFKAILAAEIIKALDREQLSVRAVPGRTGIAADGLPSIASCRSSTG